MENIENMEKCGRPAYPPSEASRLRRCSSRGAQEMVTQRNGETEREGFAMENGENIERLKIAVLMTCHNRKEKTLRCLRALERGMEKGRSKKEEGRSVEVFLVDDGCTDGTAAEVEKWFNAEERRNGEGFSHGEHGERGEEKPCRDVESVEGGVVSHGERGERGEGLTQRNGETESGGGGSRGGAEAQREGVGRSATQDGKPCGGGDGKKGFDWVLWLNDDVELFEDGLERMISAVRPSTSNLQPVVVGECCDPVERGRKTYGMQGRWFNGNVVLVPRAVWERIGIIDGAYSHAKADFDYAERVRRAGVEIVAAEGFVGSCEDDWKEKMRGKSVAERMAMLWSPGYWNLRDLWRFQAKYYGRVRAAACCVKLCMIAAKGV